MSVSTIDLVVGTAADKLLSDQQFLTAWRALYASSEHATGFQAPGFACAWYQSYRDEWQPVLVCSRTPEGALDGLWALAYDSAHQQIVHAGAHQAEYHGWLSVAGAEKRLLQVGWTLLKRAFKFSALRCKYLALPGQVETLAAAIGADARLSVQRSARPLLKLDATEVQTTAAKKSNKSRFNRLARIGTFEFKRITDAVKFEEIFDELIDFYDLRQGAINRTTPFHDDSAKRTFHSRLFAQSPEQVYCTASFIDGRPIAAFWGTVSDNMVHLGLLISSPFFAEHSPGKIHIMQLSRQLLLDGYEVLDLTPGGDAWKERFANDHDEVAEATIYRSPWNARADAMMQDIARLGKRGLGIAGLTPQHVRGAAAMLRRVSAAAVLRKWRQWRGETREYRVYRADREVADSFQPDPQVRCNSLSDLLAFEPGEAWQSREGYLGTALSRIEQGGKAYTVTIGDRLAHSGWMGTDQTVSRLTEVNQDIHYPPGSVTLYDFYSHPQFRGRGLYRVTLEHMLHSAFSNRDTRYAYIGVLADNGPSRHVIERIGFEFQGSYFWQSRFGEERKRWTTCPAASMEEENA